MPKLRPGPDDSFYEGLLNAVLITAAFLALIAIGVECTSNL